MEQQGTEIHNHFESGCNPVIYQGTNNFYGGAYTAQQNCNHAETNHNTEKPQEGSGSPEAIRALRTLAKEIPGSRRYKWGFAYQAMCENGMIKRSTSIVEFARMVERYTGISYETVRAMSQYYEPSGEFRGRIEEILEMIGSCDIDAKKS